jgi:DNA-binding beta-propeller fold protein YncE
MKHRFLPATLAIALLASVIAPACRADGPYHFLKEIAVGGDGGWDYLSIDADARRLYVSHATKVVVIDLDKDAVAGEIADTPGVHGFAIAPELGLGFSSNGKEGKVSIVDLKTLKTTSKVDTGENPDAILYESGQQEVYAFNGRGQSATVFEAKTGKVTATIPLPGKPEFAAADPKAGRVYCNIEDKSEVVAIDTKTHQVVNTWPIAPGEEASGLVIDVANKRLFIGCHNQLMLMMDSTSGKVIANVPIGQGVDANAFDPGTMLAFASCGDGTVTVAHEETPDKLTPVQSLATEHGARTMALDPKTHNIYLASAKFEAPSPSPAPDAAASPAAGAPPAPRQRPKMIPGSFKILVYGNGK